MFVAPCPRLAACVLSGHVRQKLSGLMTLIGSRNAGKRVLSFLYIVFVYYPRLLITVMACVEVKEESMQESLSEKAKEERNPKKKVH